MDGVEARCSGEAPALHEAEKLNAVDIVTQTDLGLFASPVYDLVEGGAGFQALD